MFAPCRLRACLLLAVALTLAGCSRSVDVKQALEVADTSSGWYDAGIVEGKNKIVPSVTFRLKKKPDADLAILRHSQFRDIRARIFAKYSSSQWVEIGTVDVQRQLIVR
jgi:hypothetical protein